MLNAHSDWRPEKNLSDVKMELDTTGAWISPLISPPDLQQILDLIARLRVDDFKVLSVRFYPPGQTTNVTIMLRVHMVEIERAQGTKWVISTVHEVWHCGTKDKPDHSLDALHVPFAATLQRFNASTMSHENRDV
jgi:hypothetical protein